MLTYDCLAETILKQILYKRILWSYESLSLYKYALNKNGSHYKIVYTVFCDRDEIRFESRKSLGKFIPPRDRQ